MINLCVYLDVINVVVKHHPFDLLCLFFVYSDPIFETKKLSPMLGLSFINILRLLHYNLIRH